MVIAPRAERSKIFADPGPGAGAVVYVGTGTG